MKSLNTSPFPVILGRIVSQQRKCIIVDLINMRLFFLTIIAILIYEPFCAAQIDFKKIAPPNPNVASIMKAALTPVTEYAGTASVGIPLYTINVDNVTLPISLSYQTGGIQVAEESGVVGLGWALNAGGVITRNKMGMDDFADNSQAYLMHGQEHPNLPLNSGGYFDPNFDRFLNADSQGKFLVGSQLTYFGIPDYGVAQTDFMPDVFNFNFNGYSGSFVLKRDGTVHLLEKKGIKIIPEINGSPMNVNFTIITENGTKYAFREKAVSQTAFENNTRYISSWHLSEITTVNNNVIAFSYDNHIGKSLPLKTFIQHYQVASPNGNGTNGYINSSGPQNQIDDIYLNSIQFPSGVVIFNYSAQGERSDISEAHYLKDIQVTDKNTKLIKRHDFKYTYFGSAFNGTTSLFGGDYGGYVSNTAGVPDLNLRLRLDAVVEDDTKTHSFEYYGSNLVHNKTSMAQDYWGFYNGIINSQSFIPYQTDLNGSPNDIPKKAKRHPVLSKAKVFNLKKITYPTKGYTEFDYELNTFDGSNFEEPAPPTVEVISDPAFDTGDSGQNIENSVTIAPNASSLVLRINLDIYNYQGVDPASHDFVFSSHMRVKLIRDSDQYPVFQGGFDSPLGNFPEPAWQDFIADGQVSQSYTVENVPINPNETYTLTAFFDDHDYHTAGVDGEYSGVADIRAEWVELNVSETEAYSVGGGLRVKSIEDHDYNGDLARKRNFNYHYTDANGIEKSYGKIKTLPNYDTDQTSITTVMENRENVQVVIANAVSHNSFSKDMGSYVGYDQVEIEEVDCLGNNNGKTVSMFNNSQDVLQSFNGDILHKDDYYEYPR